MNYKIIAKQLGSLGGKQSVKIRFEGKTKEEISELMRKIRMAKINKEKQEKFDGIKKLKPKILNLKK